MDVAWLASVALLYAASAAAWTTAASICATRTGNPRAGLSARRGAFVQLGFWSLSHALLVWIAWRARPGAPLEEVLGAIVTAYGAKVHICGLALASLATWAARPRARSPRLVALPYLAILSAGAAAYCAIVVLPHASATGTGAINSNPLAARPWTLAHGITLYTALTLTAWPAAMVLFAKGGSQRVAPPLQTALAAQRLS